MLELMSMDDAHKRFVFHCLAMKFFCGDKLQVKATIRSSPDRLATA